MMPQFGPGEIPSHPQRLYAVARRLRSAMDSEASVYVGMRAAALVEMALELERIAWLLERVGCESGSEGPPF